MSRPLVVIVNQNQRAMVSRCTQRFKLLGFKNSKPTSKDFNTGSGGEYSGLSNILGHRPSANKVKSYNDFDQDLRHQASFTSQQKAQEIDDMVEAIKKRNMFK